MWYDVPESKPKPAEQPKAIFPWEQQPNRPKATRVFAEDLNPTPAQPPPPIPAAVPGAQDAPLATHPFSTVHYEEGEGEGSKPEEVQAAEPSPPRAASPQTADEQWQAFQQSNTNAWDTVPGIDTYVRAIMEAQARRAKPQVLQPVGEPEILSPSLDRKNRRESLIITDFPSAVERPSLPVTPAPIRRPTFWGEERDEAGDLPQAEGVPDQADWVCPKCGFSSVRAEDFHPHRRESSSIASTTTALATPSPSTSFAPAVQIPPKPEAPAKPDPPKDSPVETLATPPEVKYKAGVSSRGAPLASLTDPSLLPPPTHLPGINVPSSSAPDVEPALASTI